MSDADIPELRSERLVLRRHVEADLEAAAAMWSDPDVIRYIGGRAFSREEVWHRILRYLGHWQLRPFGYWAIHERIGDRFVGEIGLADWKRSKVRLDSPEVGWVLIPAVHRRGYATEAISLALDWADALPLPRTCCIIDEDNRASIKLAERFGYLLSDKTGGDAPAIFERPRPPAAPPA